MTVGFTATIRHVRSKFFAPKKGVTVYDLLYKKERTTPSSLVKDEQYLREF